MKMSDVKRATWVKRWGIVRTLREQNIAEHSFMVAMISSELMARVGFPVDEGGALSGARAGEVLRWALWHDMAEVFTGDIPTPTKLRMKNGMADKLQEIEDDLAPEVASIRKDTNDFIIKVVKVADYLEAISFLQEEGGNDDADDVRLLLMVQLVQFIDNWNSGLRRHYDDVIALSEEMGINGLKAVPRVS